MEKKEKILCGGCLCADRKMKEIDKFNEKQCFMQILNEMPIPYFHTDPLLLCWECNAIIRRFVKFKQQVQECCKLLYDYKKQNLSIVQLERPPKLRTQQILDFDLNLHLKSSQIKSELPIDYVKVKEEILPENNDDNLSVYSDNFDDDTALLEYSNRKREKIPKQRKKKKKVVKVELVKEIVLTVEELIEERKLLSQREEYINAMFRCEKCLISFPNVDDLNDHINIKHDANKSNFICDICQCTFTTEVSYNYHTNKHKRRYQCSICKDKFPSKGGVMKHYEMVHCHGTDDLQSNGISEENGVQEHIQENESSKEAEMFPCEFCHKTFRWKTSLRKHMETHRIETGQKRKPYCEPCRLSFSTTSNLQKHVKSSSKHQIQLKLRKLKESFPESSTPEKERAHIEQIKCSVNDSRQQYPCPLCDKRFQWRGNLHRHLSSHKARANGELVCEPCNRTFSSIATYNQHMKISKRHVTENDFKYMCNDCGKKFANKTRLKDHIDWEHLKNYVHICNVCQKVFKSHTSLYLHKQVVHKKDNAEHLCDHCGKHFPNHAKLRSHIIGLHSSEAPYKCTWCGARFSWHSCLSRHARRVHRDKIV